MMPVAMVGRGEQLREIGRAWARVAATRSAGVRTVVVTGPAGVGKSRLVSAALERFTPRPYNVLHGTARVPGAVPYDWLAAVLSGTGTGGLPVPAGALAWLARYPDAPRERYAPRGAAEAGRTGGACPGGWRPVGAGGGGPHALDPASVSLVAEVHRGPPVPSEVARAARSLEISIRTVTVNLSNLLRKTGSASRTEAALWAVRHRLARPYGAGLTGPAPAGARRAGGYRPNPAVSPLALSGLHLPSCGPEGDTVAARPGGRRGALSARLDTARARLDAVRTRLEGTVVWRAWERLLENEFIDRSVALAAKAFIALFPLAIAVAAFAPQGIRREINDVTQTRFGLAGSARSLVVDAFARPDQTRAATGVFGLLFLFFYATTFTTALQRVYLRAWRRPRAGGVPAARGMVWLAGLIVLVGLTDTIRHVLGRGPQSTLGLLAWGLMSVFGWWATSWLMLRGEVRWRALAASALVTGVATIGYSLTTTLWMPRTVQQNQAQFGVFGITLALVSWFVGLGFVLVIATVLGAVLAEEPGRLGRLARGGAGGVLRPGAAAPLGPPVRPLSVTDALVARGPEDA